MKNVELISSLIQQHQNMKMDNLEVRGEIGADGWNALARAMVSSPGVVSYIVTDRGALSGPLGGHTLGQQKRTCGAIWVQLAPRGNILVDTHCRKGDFVFFNWDGEGDWRRI